MADEVILVGPDENRSGCPCCGYLLNLDFDGSDQCEVRCQNCGKLTTYELEIETCCFNCGEDLDINEQSADDKGYTCEACGHVEEPVKHN